jgi:hypothetical protein
MQPRAAEIAPFARLENDKISKLWRTEMRILSMASFLPLLAACHGDASNAPDANGATNFQMKLRKVLQDKPEGSSRAVAIVKSGMAGPDWLVTVHGYADNRAVCEQLIREYNEDSELSVLPGEYYCEEI